jgi:hypothetical protein
MPDWSPYQIALVCLLNALGLHVLAAFWALRPLRRILPRCRLAWLAFCLGQILLVRLSWGLLELALTSGLYDTLQAVLTFLVALAMLGASFGLVPLVTAPDESAARRKDLAKESA